MLLLSVTGLFVWYLVLPNDRSSKQIKSVIDIVDFWSRQLLFFFRSLNVWNFRLIDAFRLALLLPGIYHLLLHRTVSSLTRTNLFGLWFLTLRSSGYGLLTHRSLRHLCLPYRALVSHRMPVRPSVNHNISLLRCLPLLLLLVALWLLDQLLRLSRLLRNVALRLGSVEFLLFLLAVPLSVKKLNLCSSLCFFNLLLYPE